MASPTTQRVFSEILERIRSGRWPVGTELPSERKLIEELGVSRIPLREALSMLRVLGVLETRHGSGTTVRRVEADIIAQLLPLLVTLEGQRTFDQIFELRLALEPRTAYLAALRRSDADADHLNALVRSYREAVEGGLDESVELDRAFHERIAEASGNPLFAVLQRTLGNFMTFTQVESCKDDPVRRRQALHAHESIAEAIVSGDAERARVEMEAHLRTSAGRRIRSGAPGELSKRT